MAVTSTPVWHDIFRKVTLKPDNITLEAEKIDDTLNIVRGPGVNFGTTNVGTDTFEINVDYNISVPVATTKISLEDVNGNLSEITLSSGRGVVINRISAQELEFESFSVTETDTLHTVTERNNITSNKIFVNDIEVGTIASNSSEDGFTSYDPGHNLIGDGTLDNSMRFSPLYQDSIAANNTDQFEFVAVGPGTLAYAANYVFDTAATTGSVTLEREDPANPGNWTTLDTQTGNTAGIAYFIDGTYSELYSGSVTYRLTFAWTGNTGTATWYTNATFEGGAYTPVANPQLKTDTSAKTVDINDIQFFQNTIRTLASNTDVVVEPAGTGQLRVLGDITADMLYGDVTGNVTGDVSGNAGTVTNGVYTTGSYADPSWITSLDGSKLTGTVVATNGVVTTNFYADPSWITSLDASKIVGEIDLSNILVDGTIRIFDNVIETVVSNADLELRPSGTGQVVVAGDLTANMLYGDVTGNVNGNLTGNVAGNVTGDIIGNVTSTLVNTTEIIIDNTVRVYNNVIETVLSNSNLELRANGTGQVVVTDAFTASEIVGPIGTSVQNSGAFTTLSASQTVTLNSANNNISLQPTGTGTVTINPATAGTINNMSIGATTRAAGNFTTLDANGNVTLGSDDSDTITVNGLFPTGTQFRSAKTNGNTLNIAAWDVDGALYTNLITLTASNTPTLSLVSIGAMSISSTSAGDINNMNIGATTRAAGNFTNLDANGNVTLGSDDNDIITSNGRFAAGTQIRASKLDTNTLNISAFDVDGAVYSNLVILTSANTPTLGLASLNRVKELVTVGTAPTAAVTVDVLSGSIYYYTNAATTNWTINFRGNAGTTMNTYMNTGESVTIAVYVTNTGTAFYNTQVQVDGTTAGVLTEWLGGSAPGSGNINSIDLYTYTIVKTAASTYTVFAAQIRYA